MEFKKYSSIENSYQKSQVEQVYAHDYQDNEFIVQEKVHGANFSIWIDYEGDVAKAGSTLLLDSEKRIRCAKRTAFLNESDDFYGWQKIRAAFRSLYLPIVHNAKVYSAHNYTEDLKQITIFGELCGGYYKHSKVQNTQAKKIQKGIIYSPEIEFIAFDVLINGRVVSEEFFNNFCDGIGIKRVPTLFKGTFEQCLKYPNEFRSRIHEVFGYPDPEVEENVCEGVVIKSAEPLFFRNGQRVIFKNKNQKWSEKSQVKKNSKTIEPLVLPSIYHEKISDLINENRVAAAISKIGEPSMKIMGQVIKAVNLDIIEESTKLGYFNGLEKEDIKKIQKAISNKTPKMIRDYIIANHV